MAAELERIGAEASEVEGRIAAANAERDRCAAQVGEARSAIGQREAESILARESLPAAETKAQEAAAAVRAAEGEMSTAEQAQGVEETRESHALKLLSQIEARKNRLKQENMALVFPEPEKLAAVESERRDAASGSSSWSPGCALPRSGFRPSRTSGARRPTSCRRPRASLRGWKRR
jgi:chromosome segregation protein